MKITLEIPDKSKCMNVALIFVEDDTVLRGRFQAMEYKGYDLRFNVRWLVNGQTHDAAVGVFKDGYMVAPCDDLHTAQRFVDQRVAREEREQRERERRESDRQESQRVRRTRPARK